MTTAAGTVLSRNADGTVQVRVWGGTITASTTEATSLAAPGQACTLTRVGDGVSGSWQLSALPPPGALGPNLVPNPSFVLVDEVGVPAGWTSASSTGACSVVASPDASAAGGPAVLAVIDAEDPPPVGVIETATPFFIDPGQTYTVSVKIATTSDVPGARVSVDLLTSASPNMRQEIDARTTIPAAALATVGATWVELSGAATPPEGEEYALVRITMTAAASTPATFMITDVAIRATLT